MLNNADARKAAATVVDPVARGLLRIGVTPDMVTVVGAAGTAAAALVFFRTGAFFTGLAFMVVLTMSDLLDGTMARMRGTAGPWGNFLDSTLDRVTDGAVFGALLWWSIANGQTVAAWAALVCLVGGFTISYAKARAESVGATANVGIAERAERLIVAYLAALLTGFGLDWAMPVLLTILAVLVVITVVQRFVEVRRQLVAPPPAQAAPPHPAGEA